MSGDRVKLLRSAHLATLQSVRLLLARLAESATSFYESKAMSRLGSELDEVILNFQSDDSPAILALERDALRSQLLDLQQDCIAAKKRAESYHHGYVGALERARLSQARADACAYRTTTLFDAIAHGDDKHRTWLKQALEDHFAGRPVEKP